MNSEWKEIKLGKVCSFEKKTIHPKKGILYNLYSLPSYDNNKEPETIDGEDIKSNKYQIKKGDILYNKLNVEFKRIWNMNHELLPNSICSTEFIPIQSIKLDNNFLYYLLNSYYFTKYMSIRSTGTSKRHQRINQKDLENIKIKIPSLTKQKSIGKILQNLDSKIEIN